MLTTVQVYELYFKLKLRRPYLKNQVKERERELLSLLNVNRNS